jgi:hypothetical protein
MKIINKVVEQITKKLSFRLLIAIGLLLSPISPISLPQVDMFSARVQADPPAIDPSGQTATSQFGKLFDNAKKLSAVLLAIGCIIGGIMFMTGAQEWAIRIFVGSVIVFGGAYVVSLIGGAF